MVFCHLIVQLVRIRVLDVFLSIYMFCNHQRQIKLLSINTNFCQIISLVDLVFFSLWIQGNYTWIRDLLPRTTIKRALCVLSLGFHNISTMFQITRFNVWKNIIGVWRVCVCVCFFKSWQVSPLVEIEDESFMCCLIKWALWLSIYLQKCHWVTLFEN